MVFRAWTDPERLKRWWGPKGFTNPVCEVDVRPGGAIRIDMRAPDGVVYPMTGTFIEIVEPERLVFTSSALDNNGEPLFEVLNTVTFAEEGGKTKLTVHARVSKVKGEAAPHLAGMEQGWSMTLDRLAEEVGRVTRTRVLWIIQGLLALMFLFAGGVKLVLCRGDALTKETPMLSAAFLRFVGVCEVLGAIGLILPGLLRIRPGLTPLAAAGLIVIMIGATVITLMTTGVVPWR